MVGQNEDQWILRHIESDFREKAVVPALESYLGEEGRMDEETTRAYEEISARLKEISTPRTVALNELGEHDPEVKKYREKCQYLASELKTFLQKDDLKGHYKQLEQVIRDNTDDGYTREQLECISRITSAKKKREEDLHKRVQELVDSLESENKIWNEVLTRYEVPSELTDDVDNLFQTIQLRTTLLETDKRNLTSQQKSILRAHLIQEHGPNVFANTIKLDVIKGKYDRNFPYLFGNLVDGYFQLDDDIQRKRKLMKAHGNLALTISTGMLVAVMVGTLVRPEQLHEKPYNIDTFSLSTGPQRAELDQFDRHDPGVVIPINPGGDGSSGGNGSGSGSEGNNGSANPGQGSESQDQSGQGEQSSPPDYSGGVTPENSGDLSQQEYWEIQGEIPDSYFRSYTAEDFYTNPIWESSAQALGRLDIDHPMSEATTILVSTFSISHSGNYNLPVPIGETIVSLKLEGVSASEYHVFFKDDGSFNLYLDTNLSKPVKITMGIKPSEKIFEHPMNGDQNIETLIGNPELLPPDVKAFLDSIKNSSDTDEQKAEKIRQYVQEEFIYSLQPKYSDYYKSVHKPGEYVRRALELKFGDCDVVNTIQVAFLRYAGLHARMAYGFANGQNLFDKNSKILEGAESHGWAEFFSEKDQKWVVSDATPSKMDEDAALKLKKHNGGIGIQDILHLGSIDELKESLFFFFASLKDFRTNSDGAVDILLLLLATVLGYGAPFLYNRGVRENIDKLIRKTTNRARLGDSPAEMAFILHVNKYADELLMQSFRKIEDEETTLGKLTAFTLNSLMLPAWLKMAWNMKGALDIHKRVKKADGEFDQKADETYFQFMKRIFGIDERKLKKRISEREKEYLCEQMRIQILSSIVEHFRGGVVFDYRLREKIELEELAKYAPSDELFITFIVDDLYKQYLIGHAEKLKRMAREKGVKKITSNRSVANDMDNQKVAMEKDPISKQRFLEVISPEIPALLSYRDVMNGTREKVEVAINIADRIKVLKQWVEKKKSE